MAATHVLALVLCFQQPSAPVVDETVRGVIDEGAEEIRSPALNANQFDLDPVGVVVPLRVSEAGPYFLDLHSFAFDAYLILHDRTGMLVGEDDDGLGTTHARLVLDLTADHEYRLTLGALNRGQGEYSLLLRSGSPASMTTDQRYEMALDDATRRISWTEDRHGRVSPESRESWNELALVHWYAGKTQEALAPAEQALQIALEVFGENHADTSQAINQIAGIQMRLGNKEEALGLFERALAIRIQTLGADHPDTSLMHMNLGAIHGEMGVFREAASHFRRAYDIREMTYGNGHQLAVQALRSLARVMDQARDHSGAEWAYRRLLQALESALGPEHVEVGRILQNLGKVLLRQGLYDQALPLFQRSLAIEETVPLEVNPTLAVMLDNMGECYRILGRAAEASPLFERSAKIQERVQGPDQVGLAMTLAHHSLALEDLGDYSGSRQMIERALAILVRDLGEDHYLVTFCLNGYGELLASQGNLQEALPIFERLMTIRERLAQRGRAGGSPQMRNLLSLATSQNRLQQVTPLFELALDVDIRIHGEGHIQTLRSTTDLGSLKMSQGAFEEARTLFERVLAIRERELGPDHVVTGNSVNSLAILMKQEGRYEEAQPLYERALRIWEKVFGPGHPDVAVGLSNLASLLSTQGEYDQAQPHFLRAMSIMESARGPEHPETVEAMVRLAVNHHNAGRHAESTRLFEEGVRRSLRRLDRELPLMSEAGRFQTLAVHADPSNYLSSLFNLEEAPLDTAFSLYLQWKGKATRIQAAGLSLAQQNQDEGLSARFAEITQVAQELSALVLLPILEQAEDHAVQVVQLRDRRLRLERRLNQDLGVDRILATPTAIEVQDAIPEGGVLVDFFVGKQVYAWVVPPRGQVRLVLIGDLEEPRRVQAAYLNASGARGGRSDSAVDTSAAVQVLSRLWEPLREAIGDADTVLLCPDGFLCELPFEILKDQDGSYLIEKHRFVYLSDPTRLVVSRKKHGASVGGVLALGNVDYAQPDLQDAAESSPSGNPDRSTTQWDSLAGTAAEIQGIQDLYAVVHGVGSGFTRIEGREATEEALRQQLPGHSFVHLATHGYFDPQQASLQGDELLPGLRSGLVLAGVNRGPDPIHGDGYLSAEEIQRIDLSQCELAVLSACETALGSRQAGEGLLSLRRAFEVAGAASVVSSLWKVNDAATAVLMNDFYTNLWLTGMGKGDALHQAKLKMLQRNREEFNGDARPSTWGAFVLSGDWR